MFEYCNASIACLGIAIGNFIMHSVSLSTPCSLQKPNGLGTDLCMVIKCSASLAIGHMDMSSITIPVAAQQSGHIHLSGTSGQLNMLNTNSWCGRHGSYKQKCPFSLLSEAACGVHKMESYTTNDIIHQPDLSPQDSRHATGSCFEITSYEFIPSSASTLTRPNCTAMIHTSSIVDTHRDGYIIYPAILDAVTHTAAALDFQQSSNHRPPSAFFA